MQRWAGLAFDQVGIWRVGVFGAARRASDNVSRIVARGVAAYLLAR